MADMRAAGAGTELSDGRWQVRITLTLPNGHKVRKALYGASQREAQDAARVYLHGSGRNLPLSITIAELCDIYESARKAELKAGTWRKYGPAIKFFRARFAHLQAHALDRPTLARWLQDMKAAKVPGQTIQVRRNVAGLIFKFGAGLGLDLENPAQDLPLPSGLSLAPRKRPKMTSSIYRLILETETDGVRRDLWETLGEGGFRPSEALAMTRDSIVYRADLYWLKVGDSKTPTGEHREVPIPDGLAHRLMERSGYLFPSETGSALRLDNLRVRHWDPMVRALGYSGLLIYKLRSMCLTRWSLGFPEDVVKQLAGHKDIRTTKKHYVDLSRADVEAYVWSGQNVRASDRASKSGGAPLGLDDFPEI